MDLIQALLARGADPNAHVNTTPVRGFMQGSANWANFDGQTAFPAMLLLGLVSYSFVVLHENEKRPAAREIAIGVTGQQFAWTYQYPPSVTGGAALNSYKLYIPKDYAG